MPELSRYYAGATENSVPLSCGCGCRSLLQMVLHYDNGLDVRDFEVSTKYAYSTKCVL